VEDQEQKQAKRLEPIRRKAEAKTQEEEEKKKKRELFIWKKLPLFFIGLLSFMTELFLFYKGEFAGGIFLLIVTSILIALCFVKKEKPKTVYAICPNTKCDFEGEIQLKTSGEIAKEAFLLNLCNIGVIYTDSVICPKCGCRIR
jgi:hypothetical protein